MHHQLRLAEQGHTEAHCANTAAEVLSRHTG